MTAEEMARELERMDCSRDDDKHASVRGVCLGCLIDKLALAQAEARAERDAQWREAFDAYVLKGTEPMCRHCSGILRDSLDPTSCDHCKPLRALLEGK